MKTCALLPYFSSKYLSGYLRIEAAPAWANASRGGGGVGPGKESLNAPNRRRFSWENCERLPAKRPASIGGCQVLGGGCCGRKPIPFDGSRSQFVIALFAFPPPPGANLPPVDKDSYPTPSRVSHREGRNDQDGTAHTPRPRPTLPASAPQPHRCRCHPSCRLPHPLDVRRRARFHSEPFGRIVGRCQFLVMRLQDRRRVAEFQRGLRGVLRLGEPIRGVAVAKLIPLPLAEQSRRLAGGMEATAEIDRRRERPGSLGDRREPFTQRRARRHEPPLASLRVLRAHGHESTHQIHVLPPQPRP